MDDEALEPLIEMVEAMVSGGMPLDVVRGNLIRASVARDLVDRAIEIARQRRSLSKVPVLKQRGRENWYPGPASHHKFWPAVKSRIAERLDEAAVDAIDDLTTSTLNSMSPPGTDAFHDRGLVLGYVQSGKTTNFTALCAKAADTGYKLIIVLSGLTDSLREQTQERLDVDLVGAGTEHQWQQLTSMDSDFVAPVTSAANMLAVNPSPLLAVVKKNPARLQKLLDWLRTAGTAVLGNTPILIIDDEADQASVNTGKDDTISRINHLIRQLVEAPRASYVAYTATPFANFLIDPKLSEDLYPRTFIVAMPLPI